MSRFSALKDEDSQSDNEFSMLEPSYTYSEIISTFSLDKLKGPPKELTHYQNIINFEPQLPRCPNFVPPTKNINSQIYYNQDKSKQQKLIGKPGGKGPRIVGKGMHKQKFQTEEQEEPGIQWFYKDQFDRVLGPYTSKRMKEWYDLGLFTPELLVKTASSESKFKPVSDYFPDTDTAFDDRVMTEKFSREAAGWGSTEKRVRLIVFSYGDNQVGSSY